MQLGEITELFKPINGSTTTGFGTRWPTVFFKLGEASTPLHAGNDQRAIEPLRTRVGTSE